MACPLQAAGAWALIAWQCSLLTPQTSRCRISAPSASPVAHSLFPITGSSVFPCHEARGRVCSLSVPATAAFKRVASNEISVASAFSPRVLFLLQACPQRTFSLTGKQNETNHLKIDDRTGRRRDVTAAPTAFTLLKIAMKSGLRCCCDGHRICSRAAAN